MDWLKKSNLCLLLFASEVKADELVLRLQADSNISATVISVRNATYADFYGGVVLNEVYNKKIHEKEADIQFIAGTGLRLAINDNLLRLYGEIHQGITKPELSQVNKDLYVVGINLRQQIGNNKNFDLYLQKNFSRTNDFENSYSVGVGLSFVVE